MLNVAIKLAKSNIFYRKERTILTSSSIALSVLISFILLSIVQGFLITIEKSIKNKDIQMIITTRDIPIEIGPIVIDPSINSIPFELYNTLTLYENELKFTPVYKSIINLNNKLIPVISLDLQKIKDFYPSIAIDTPFIQPNQILVGKNLGYLFDQNSITLNNQEFQIYKINKEINGYEDYSIFMDFRDYLKISSKTNLSQIWLKNIWNINKLSTIVSKYDHLMLVEYKKVNYLQQVIISGLKILQVIMIIASISIALIASTNTILITTFERIPEFTILLAIGAPRIVIFTTLLIEGLFLSLTSSIIGLILGIITTTLVSSSIQSALNISIPLIANTYVVSQQVIIISILIGIISSILPAYIASTIDVTSSIRQIN